MGGLSASHDRPDLTKALLEGTATKMELVRRAGERVADDPIESFVAAGVGCGVYADAAQAYAAVARPAVITYWPKGSRHRVYRRLFEGGYLRLQTILKDYYRWLHSDPPTL